MNETKLNQKKLLNKTTSFKQVRIAEIRNNCFPSISANLTTYK